MQNYHDHHIDAMRYTFLAYKSKLKWYQKFWKLVKKILLYKVF